MYLYRGQKRGCCEWLRCVAVVEGKVGEGVVVPGSGVGYGRFGFVVGVSLLVIGVVGQANHANVVSSRRWEWSSLVRAFAVEAVVFVVGEFDEVW